MTYMLFIKSQTYIILYIIVTIIIIYKKYIYKLIIGYISIKV